MEAVGVDLNDVGIVFQIIYAKMTLITSEPVASDKDLLALIQYIDPSWNYFLDEDESPEIVLGSEQGETLARLGIELAKLRLEVFVRRPQLHVGSAYTTMIMFHHFFIVFCVPVPFISGYLSTFLGEYAIFWGKNLEEWGKVRIFATVKMSILILSLPAYRGVGGSAEWLCTILYF